MVPKVVCSSHSLWNYCTKCTILGGSIQAMRGNLGSKFGKLTKHKRLNHSNNLNDSNNFTQYRVNKYVYLNKIKKVIF